jgi:hypothetical protein
MKAFGDAREALMEALRLNANGYGALVGTGLLLRREDRLAEAVDSLSRALVVEPTGAWAANELVVTTVARGETNAALLLADLLCRQGALAPGRARFLQDYAQYIENWSRHTDNETFNAPPGNHMDLLGKVIGAAQARQSASLVRLGDGEGCFLLGTEATVSPQTLEHTRNYMLKAWFGDHSASESLLRTIETDFLASIRTSTVLGIPTRQRLQYELRNDARGAMGVCAVLKAARNLLQCVTPLPLLADASINNALYGRKALLASFAGVDCIFTVSPHADLGRRLRSFLGVSQGEDLIVPGQADSLELPAAARIGSHLAKYAENLAWLRQRGQPGQLYLIAAGLLGKCYCGVVQTTGAVAVDIGAAGDFWLGYATRGHHHLARGEDLVLPEPA